MTTLSPVDDALPVRCVLESSTPSTSAAKCDPAPFIPPLQDGRIPYDFASSESAYILLGPPPAGRCA
eukprot:1177474-Prorocentrum_minimum.AAC.1